MGTLFGLVVGFAGGVYVGKTHYEQLMTLLKNLKDKVTALFKKKQ